MYTRSYGNQRNGVRTQLPPDYGGTALVIKQPEAQSENKSAVGYDDKNGGIITERRSRRQMGQNRERTEPLHRTTDTTARRSLDDARPRRNTENKDNKDDFRPPFGGETGVETAETAASAFPDEGRLFSQKGMIFDPEHLKSDDLLLLGLLFLLFSDESDGEGRSESCREALLILAVLYLSGL